MKRKIKFNAWDGSKMLINVGTHPHMIKPLVKIDNCENQDSDCEYEKDSEGSVIVCNKFDAYTLLQFTGLKDKNNKEIYEGDIIKTITDKPMVISWSDKFASFVINKDGWMFSHWFGESCNSEDCEVIGNIYENKDLLNKI